MPVTKKRFGNGNSTRARKWEQQDLEWGDQEMPHHLYHFTRNLHYSTLYSVHKAGLYYMKFQWQSMTIDEAYEQGNITLSTAFN